MISTSSLSTISHLASNPLIDRGNKIKKKGGRPIRKSKLGSQREEM